jgi:hypothetical protein
LLTRGKSGWPGKGDGRETESPIELVLQESHAPTHFVSSKV